MENGLTLETVTDHVDRFLNDTIEAREMSEKCRDYFDHKQWTEEEAKKLRSRHQAPIVVNRIRPKIKGLVGLYNVRNSDPKAFPRTKKHEKAANAVTDALRYVADNNDFTHLRLDVAEDFFVEGYGGAVVNVRQKKTGDVEIIIEQIPWDRIYYDPHSRRKDFSDCRYKGMYLWMYESEVNEKFPDVDLDQLFKDNSHTDETTEDRPRWVDSKERRVRIAVHFCMHNGVWYMSIFTDGAFLLEPQESPYLDDEGEPSCPIELVCANIDRDNRRYGEARGFLDQQDEINHRRSKFLFMNSARQTHGRKGAVKDVAALKREMAKPDGHVEWDGEEFNKDFGILPTGDMSKAQVDLYLDAKAELDAVSFNAQLSGERQEGDLSGRAIEKLQAAGTIELNQDYALLAGWEKRIYRQIWARIKQYWTEEKWVRVTDDQDSLRWVGLNSQITAQQFLEETINDESKPLTERKQASAAYQFMVQNNDPRLNEIVGVSNDVAELDVDIILDQSFDSVNVQQEQFQALVQFAQGGDIDIIELIQLSQLRGKDELIEKIEKRRAQAAEAAGNVADIQAQGEKAKMMKTAADADKSQAEAMQKKIENVLLINQPERVTSVAV